MTLIAALRDKLTFVNYKYSASRSSFLELSEARNVAYYIEKILPIFAGMLLLYFAASSWMHSMQSKKDLAANIESEFETIATISSAKLALLAQGNVSLIDNDRLVASMPESLFKNGRRLFVSNQLGEIVFSLPKVAPEQLQHQPKTIAELLGTSAHILQKSLEVNKGVAQLELNNKIKAHVSIRKIVTLKNAAQQANAQPNTAKTQSAASLETTGDTVKEAPSPIASNAHETLMGNNQIGAHVGTVVLYQPTQNIFSILEDQFGAVKLLIAMACISIIGLAIANSLHQKRSFRREQAREGIENNVERALAHGHCGLWDWDLHKGRIYWSRSMNVLLGRGKVSSALSLADIRAMQHSDDKEFFAVVMEAILEKRRQIFHEFRLKHVDGHWVWVRAQGELATQAANDKSYRFIGIVIDMTAEKAFKEQREHENIRLRDAIDVIPEAFGLWDADKKLVLCNSRYQELHNVPSERVFTGMDNETFMALANLPEPKAPIKMPANEKTGAMISEMEMPDGSWLQVSERRTKGGGYVFLGTDVTARKQQTMLLSEREMQLNVIIHSLDVSQKNARRQAQANADLAKKFENQRNKAEAANRAKNAFLANMSHKFNTPLNAVIGYSDAMTSEVFGPIAHDKYREYLQDINQSGHELKDLVADVLYMAQLEMGQKQLERKPIFLSHLLHDLQVEFAPRGASKLVDVKILPNQTEMSLKIDEEAFMRALRNFIQNSLDFTPEGGQIGVDVKKQGDHFALYIIDTGIGISKEKLSQMGKPFQNLEANPYNICEKSGLGFAIAKSIIEQHGGRVRIRSRENIGTVIMLRLPCEMSAQYHLPPTPRSHEVMALQA